MHTLAATNASEINGQKSQDRVPLPGGVMGNSLHPRTKSEQLGEGEGG